MTALARADAVIRLYTVLLYIPEIEIVKSYCKNPPKQV